MEKDKKKSKKQAKEVVEEPEVVEEKSRAWPKADNQMSK
jgi:hypothetical protein